MSVYFAQAADGAVKIGRAHHVHSRVVTLARLRGCVVKTIAEWPGEEWVERMFHDMFAAELIGREWFAPSERVLKMADALRLETVASCNALPASIRSIGREIVLGDGGRRRVAWIPAGRMVRSVAAERLARLVEFGVADPCILARTPAPARDCLMDNAPSVIDALAVERLYGIPVREWGVLAQKAA